MEDEPYELKFIIDPCPGCGLRSEMRVDAVGESCFFESTKLFLFRCENENCGHYAWSNFQPKELIGKEVPYLSEDVLKIEFELPLEVVSDFKEALSCFTHGNYNAAVVIARRLLERVLLEKGAKCLLETVWIKDKRVVAVTPQPEFEPFFDLQYDAKSNYKLVVRPRGDLNP